MAIINPKDVDNCGDYIVIDITGGYGLATKYLLVKNNNGNYEFTRLDDRRPDGNAFSFETKKEAVENAKETVADRDGSIIVYSLAGFDEFTAWLCDKRLILEEEKQIIKVGNHVVEFSEKGQIVAVGCEAIDFDKVKVIYKEMQRLQKK